MKSWLPASREFARIFYVHNQHIAVVTGRKSRRCSEVDLVRTSARAKIPTFSIVGRGEKSPIAKDGIDADRYYLVKPLLPGPAQPHIRLRHIGGIESVAVEKVSSKINSTQPHFIVSGSQRSEAAPLEASALGYSQNFSMDEAFNDALAHLPVMEQKHDVHRSLTLVDVVSMGAIYGGFSGFSRLFVKVEQTRAAMPSNAPKKPIQRIRIIGKKRGRNLS